MSGRLRDQMVDAVGILLVVVCLGVVARFLPGRWHYYDFAHYYLAGRLVLDGQNPYTTPLEPVCRQHGFAYHPSVPIATNPPSLVWLFVPLAALPATTAYWIWVAVQAGGLGVILWLTKRLIGAGLSRRAWWWFAGGVICSQPVLLHFWFSHVELLLGALLLGAYACRQRGCQVTACLLAALAGFLKPNTLLLLPWFVWAGRDTWRRAGSVALALAAGVAITGPALWLDYVRWAGPVVAQHATSRAFNLSLPSCVGLWSGSHIAGVALGAALVAVAYVICLRSGRDPESEFCLLLTVMLAGAPVAWGYYYVFLIFPLAAFVARARYWPLALLLNLMGLWRIEWPGDSRAGALFLGFLPLYGLLGLTVYFGWTILDRRAAKV